MRRKARTERFYSGTEQQEVVKCLSQWLQPCLIFMPFLRLFHLIFSSYGKEVSTVILQQHLRSQTRIAEALPLFSGLTRDWCARQERICTFKGTFWKCCPHVNTYLTSKVQVSLKKGRNWSVKTFSPAAWSQGAEKLGWTKLTFRMTT